MCVPDSVLSMNTPQWAVDLDQYYAAGIPSLSIVDFDPMLGHTYTLDECVDLGIMYDFNGVTNLKRKGSYPTPTRLNWSVSPPDYGQYEKAFYAVQNHLLHGDTYLLNLCARSELSIDCGLDTIFYAARSTYKLYVPNDIVVFSPEPFIRIKEGRIQTFPMKGTIDADIPDAEKLLTTNPKEIAEHYTIVDLLRNDLGIICQNVHVERFGYVERIQTSRGAILQMSSEIGGILNDGFEHKIGTLIFRLLPAGSVTGAPKKSTVDIIRSVESSRRGYYTGVAILSDGQTIDSMVMIRFIHLDADKRMWYHSGGGITSQSNMQDEYNELIQKVYVPLF